MYKSFDKGRSMIEMLGVLAIIGVLSVGGIAGYSKAMSSFKHNKWRQQVEDLIFNIKDAYKNEKTYIKVLNGSAYGTLPSLIRSGYKFLGWFTERNGGLLVTKDSTVTKKL